MNSFPALRELKRLVCIHFNLRNLDSFKMTPAYLLFFTRLHLKKNMFPVQRQGDNISADKELFSICFLVCKNACNFFIKKKKGKKKEFAAA